MKPGCCSNMHIYTPSALMLSWAQRLNLEFRPANDYPAAFHNAGWEDRYFIHQVDGALPFHVTQASRSSEETDLFDAYSTSVVDSFFCIFFGSAIRLGLGLPRLRPMTHRNDVVPPYAIEDSTDDKLLLLNEQGQAVISTSNSILDLGRLTRASVALTSSIEDVQQSFLSNSGAPLFQLAN